METVGGVLTEMQAHLASAARIWPLETTKAIGLGSECERGSSAGAQAKETNTMTKRRCRGSMAVALAVSGALAVGCGSTDDDVRAGGVAGVLGDAGSGGGDDAAGALGDAGTHAGGGPASTGGAATSAGELSGGGPAVGGASSSEPMGGSASGGRVDLPTGGGEPAVGGAVSSGGTQPTGGMGSTSGGSSGGTGGRFAGTGGRFSGIGGRFSGTGGWGIGTGGTAPGSGGSSSEGFGGTTITGGSEGFGGTTITGGSEGLGGTTITGGSEGLGGTVASGGDAGSGGSSGTGSDGGGTGPSSTGGGAGLSEYALAHVTGHNEVRAAVEEPANYPGTWQPLPPVTWSEEVAASAQEWADHLRDAEDCNLVHASGSGYGENLAGGWGDLSPAVAVALWAEEKADYTYSPQYEFVSASGHYTQIVWRDSLEIGCASASCGGNQSVVVCRYSPPGNVIGQQPY